jgi:hypothetical protein
MLVICSSGILSMQLRISCLEEVWILWRYRLVNSQMRLGRFRGCRALLLELGSLPCRSLRMRQDTNCGNRPLNRLIPRKSFYQGLDVINQFVNPFIDDALQLSPDELATKTKTEEGYTFLHALASYTRDRKMLRDQLVAVLLAGRDTTAATLSWTFYELARHPEAFQKLREEIIAKVGLEDAPTYQHLKDMKYLQV